MIKKYRRVLSQRKYNSKRYNKTLKTLGKWIQRKNNRLNDAYHKLSHYIVKNYDIICMETLDIKEIFQNTDFSSSLQSIAWRKLVDMIKYKCERYGKKNHPNKSMVCFKQKLQPMRILLQRLRDKKRMDMSTLPNTP